MNKLKIERLKQKAAKRRDDAVQAAQHRYEDDLRSLDKVLELMSDFEGEEAGEAAQTPPTVGPIFKRNGNGTAKGPTALVREASAKLPSPFTMPHVFEFIRERHKLNIDKTAISSSLNKMRKMGEIVQVSPGMGREPAQYRKVRKEAEPEITAATD